MTAQMLRRSFSVLLVLAFFAPGTRAAADCDALYARTPEKSTHYVLAFLNLNSSDMTSAERDKLRLMTEDRINPKLSQLSSELNSKSGVASKRYLKLIGCNTPVTSGDLGPGDHETLKRYQVIAAVWRSVDGLTYLTFPFYSSARDVRREDVEVVLGYARDAEDAFKAWMSVLEQNQSAHKAFVGLGLALALVEQNELVPAWVALCESRTALEQAASDAIRPSKREVLAVIGGLIDQEVNAVQMRVRGNTPADAFSPPASVRRHCQQPVELTETPTNPN